MPSAANHTKSEEGLEVTFTYPLKSSFGKGDHLLVAYIYPFTLSDIQYSINEIKTKFES